NECFPSVDLDGNQSIVLTLEILHTVEFGHALERTVEPVVPSVIGAMKNRRAAARLRHYLGRMVTTHIVESAQLSVHTAYCDNRLAPDGGGNKLTGLGHLIHSPRDLPGVAEYSLRFQIGDSTIDIPGARNGGSFRQWRFVVVTGQDLFDRDLSDHEDCSQTCFCIRRIVRLQLPG